MPLHVTMRESGGFDLHEEDEWHSGKLVDIEETTGEFGPGLKWVIELDGEYLEDGTPRQTWAFCSQKLSPKSKLYAWLRGIVGPDGLPGPGETIDLASLIGQRVDVMFQHVEGFDSDGNPVTKEKVVKIRRSRAARPEGMRAKQQRAAAAKSGSGYDPEDDPF